jgi:hypothetical protein
MHKHYQPINISDLALRINPISEEYQTSTSSPNCLAGFDEIFQWVDQARAMGNFSDGRALSTRDD